MHATKQQKTAIRLHWAPYTLRFNGDGTVSACKKPGAPYGLLYTAKQLGGGGI